MPLGLVRNIRFTVISGFVISACVYAKHGEVSGVSWPHPVVGVTSVFSYTFRRSRNQANVPVRLVFEQIEFVVVVETLQLKFLLAIGVHFLHERLSGFVYGGVALRLIHLHGYILEYAIGDIINAHEKADDKVIDVHFL